MAAEADFLDRGDADGLADLCTKAGLRWVVVVDDELEGSDLEAPSLIQAIAEALESGTVTRANLRDSLPGGLTFAEASDEEPDEPWPQELSEWWTSTSTPELRAEFVRDLPRGVTLPLSPDRKLIGLASYFPETVEYSALEPGAWVAQKDELLARDGPGLIFFDEDLTKDGELGLGPTGGVTLLQRAQAEGAAGPVAFGLLSGNYTIEGEAAEWQKLVTSMGETAEGRFVPISKDRLRNPSALAHGMRLVLVNAAAERLRFVVRTIIEDAAAAALNRIGGLTPWDFERAVLKSSADEGAWEVDTLLRITAIAEGRERRKLALGRRAVLDTEVDRIRTLPSSLEPLPAASEAVRTLRRDELYIDGGDINSVRLPLEAGDIFASGEDGQTFVLLAPPCDLALRPGGSRTLSAAPLVPLKEVRSRSDADDKRKRADLYAEWPAELVDGDTVWWFLDLRRPVIVDLVVLDLATFRTDGACRYAPGDTEPGLFTPQAARRKEVHRQLKRVVELLDALRSMTAANRTLSNDVKGRLETLAARGFSLEAKHVVARVDSPDLDFVWRRTGRLLEPHVTAMLGAFHAAQTRAAFEHNFAAEVATPPNDVADGKPEASD